MRSKKCTFQTGVVIKLIDETLGNTESDGRSSIGLAETSSVYNIYSEFSSRRARYLSVIFNLLGTELIVIIIMVTGICIE
jgi:hypothetical protein